MKAQRRRIPLGARIARRFYLELAGWARAFKQQETAMKHYRSALAIVPEDPQVLSCIGYDLAQDGKKREALGYFDRVIAVDPDNAEAHFDRGFVLQELNDHIAAIPAFQRAIAIDPNHDRALYGLGLSLIHLRRLDEAVPPLERNTKLQPMSPYGWYQLARTQFNRGKPEKAQAIIDHLARFEPKVARQLARETGLRAPS
jgi:tetratricopeptide (TPR) repeat protein